MYEYLEINNLFSPSVANLKFTPEDMQLYP